jgi:hypothetical protein
MAQEIRADPDALFTLAGAALAAADELGNHYRTGLGDLAPPAAAFGNTQVSAGLAARAEWLQPDARQAVYVHTQILEDDADRLTQAAFGYVAADRRAAEGMGGSRGAQV